MIFADCSIKIKKRPETEPRYVTVPYYLEALWPFNQTGLTVNDCCGIKIKSLSKSKKGLMSEWPYLLSRCIKY
jgi:hypothetical protein